jgi:hypothetical protein
MTPRTPQCEVFWSSKSSSEFSGVPEDSNPNFFQVLGFTPTLGQSGVATDGSIINSTKVNFELLNDIEILYALAILLSLFEQVNNLMKLAQVQDFCC